jgi:hypothetical protein
VQSRSGSSAAAREQLEKAFASVGLTRGMRVAEVGAADLDSTFVGNSSGRNTSLLIGNARSAALLAAIHYPC